MQLATGGSMLNFGCWSKENTDPISAQNNLCMIFGNLAELSSGKHAVDVGSGFSAPSKLWRDNFSNLHLYCVDINFKQLVFSEKQKNIEFINSTSTKLPFASNSVDRVLALESVQHFKPLSNFISEAKRILTKNGLLVMAIPIITGNQSIGKLGLLKFTWSSEHYGLDTVKELVESSGFIISEEKLIGKSVYEPLANYYIKNRTNLKKSISEKYPNYVEKILYKSILKMKKASEQKIIDYVILKCILRSKL